MAWVDSLTPNDIDGLRKHVALFGPRAFELYLILTLVIAMYGPIRDDELPGHIADYGDLDWRRIKGKFELRNGAWHVKPATAVLAAHVPTSGTKPQ